MLLTLFNFLSLIVDIWSNEFSQVNRGFYLILYVALLGAEVRLFKLNSYLLFMTYELAKKYQNEPEKMSDTI